MSIKRFQIELTGMGSLTLKMIVPCHGQASWTGQKGESVSPSIHCASSQLLVPCDQLSCYCHHAILIRMGSTFELRARKFSSLLACICQIFYHNNEK